jgi:hypothetical protein
MSDRLVEELTGVTSPETMSVVSKAFTDDAAVEGAPASDNVRRPCVGVTHRRGGCRRNEAKQ